MACTKGYITTGLGQAGIHICCSTDSNNVNASLEPDAALTYGVFGYTRFHLERVPDFSETWVRLESKNGGSWNSSVSKKHISFSNKNARGTIMRVVAEIFNNSDYTDRLGTITSNAFER